MAGQLVRWHCCCCCCCGNSTSVVSHASTPHNPQAVPKVGEGAAGGATTASNEETVKTCCDNVQKHLQKEFDRNLDIFDRYVKKNVSAATTVATANSSSRIAATAGGERHNGGATSEAVSYTHLTLADE